MSDLCNNTAIKYIRSLLGKCDKYTHVRFFSKMDEASYLVVNKTFYIQKLGSS